MEAQNRYSLEMETLREHLVRASNFLTREFYFYRKGQMFSILVPKPCALKKEFKNKNLEKLLHRC